MQNPGERKKEAFRREFPAAGVHAHSGEQTIVFLTVTTEHRQPWLPNEHAHAILTSVWREATAWIVGEYVLMPDHLHLFCSPRNLEIGMEAWISYWKSQFRKSHQHPEWRWQSRGWHHRLRQHESYSLKWSYVRENPVRKGLVVRPEDWPYWGRIHDLRWHTPS